MATAMNCTVKVYSGVPLIKGGTEVLYLSQGSAEGILSAYLHKTYTQYYYTREHENYIQVEDVIQNLEGCNYVSFQNQSHGGKLFFGFIDHLEYVNDNNTGIVFTIDPFPTYLGDTTERTDVFIVRNTPKTDLAGVNLQDDYLPSTAKNLFTNLYTYELACDTAQVYFTCATQIGGNLVGVDGLDTGIQVGMVLPNTIDLIHQNGGSIIGAFLCPTSWLAGTLNYPAVRDLGDVTLTPLSHLASYSYEKIKSGVYCKLVLTTNQGVKSYEIEDFANRNSIVFGKIGLMIPSPMVFIYPKNYKGVEYNIAEGIFMQAPALPATGNAVYTKAEGAKDTIAMIGAMGAGAMAGMNYGPVGIVAGAIGGLIGGGAKIEMSKYLKKYQAPTVESNGMPVTLPNGKLYARFTSVSPDIVSLNRIEDYFDYFGYNMECMNGTQNQVNTDDEAYLQTGTEFLSGSEKDDELNSRIMSGIKIRKTLS